MKLHKLAAAFLSAAICGLSLSGCAQKSEVSLESIESDVITETSSDGAASTSPSEEASTAESTPSSTSPSEETSTAESTPSSTSPSEETSSAPNAATSTSSSNTAESSSSSEPTSTSTTTSSSNTSSSTSTHTHSYVSKTVAPTCAEVGYTVHTCSCGDQYTTDTVDALGHDCSKAVVQPTCTKGGYTQYTCSRCGYAYKDDYTEALGHKYRSQTVKPTCTEDGYTLNICERCGEEHHDNHAHNAHHYGHDWGEWTVTREATTSESGAKKRVCSRCGETTTESIPVVVDLGAFRDEVIRLVNEERAKEGLPALSKRDDISEYAELRATEIASKFAHERPDGSDPLDYVMELPDVWSAGENIAAGYATPEGVMNGWMNSDGHRSNILGQNYGSIGVGCCRSNGRTYWVQIFTS